ncbi:MAG: phosphoribosylanthranilate isomerase [Pleomorphochaeta sp.]|nr:phosphoribosylanthranilate isomerase [Sphaerochaetaceae bacterium]MDC7243916.1 phosphoribosylanthranilate isomerase [Sphaerochaetaceae bacterium]
MKTKLKICGLKREEDILMANEIKPEYIGFVFAKSKRQVNLEKALFLKSKLDKMIKSVGVFVNEPIENVVKTVKSKAIDIVQLHGDEDSSYILKLKREVNIPIIKAIKVNKDFRNIEKFNEVNYLLIDSGGGSGKTFDWSLDLKFNKPLFIAGGISLANIEEAYKRFKPYAFDLSSSVETNGYKDFKKMKEISFKLEQLNGEDNE